MPGSLVPNTDTRGYPRPISHQRQRERRLCLLSPTQRGGLAVEDNVGSLEGNVTVDVEPDISGGLQAAEAGVADSGAVVHVLGGDGDGGIANAEGEVRQRGVAAEDPAAKEEGVLMDGITVSAGGWSV